MNRETINIFDELDDARAMIAFMENATSALLTTYTGRTPGDKIIPSDNIINGMYLLYSCIDAKLHRAQGKVETLNI